MRRCLQLAQLAAGDVAPNPMVGAVLVYRGRVIGEGYHQFFGGAHAEVNCINSVEKKDEPFISSSTLYVLLEPCAHYGKTPPCTNLIIKNKIPKVVIGCRDPFGEVNGRGIEKLKDSGVEVVFGVLEDECRKLNKRFLCFYEKHRPYVILKWAQTANGKIAASASGSLSQSEKQLLPEGRRLFISNEFTNRLVHKWRTEEAAILVGTNTALADDPQLTSRLWPGKHPVRLVVDMGLKLPSHLAIFNEDAPTIIFNKIKHDLEEEFSMASHGVGFYRVTEDVSIVHQILNALYTLKIQSVIVEGGARLLQSFIDEQSWDEARVITNEELFIDSGLPAPQLHHAVLADEQTIFSDRIQTFYSQKNNG
ncbi:MAG: bifunctional diaminohydroxyphosphoribosylaminopyrimidine deaminase/5-amino-6-(5-phosphoribosylamino)uracil reductase RibD [Chitinophagaceae bacterium]